MKTRLSSKPISSAILIAALCFGGAAYAQGTNSATNTNAAKPASGDTQDQYPDLVEIDPFGGISTWGQVMRGLDTKLHDGWLAGGRIAINP
ncbi:MAG TPA: hypothetical protein VKV05_08245, partial [Terriglobales bacterium]|nr:hypothetical protein [Terriglobales bacterium]